MTKRRLPQEGVANAIRSQLPYTSTSIETLYRATDRRLTGQGITDPASLDYQWEFAADYNVRVAHYSGCQGCWPAEYHDDMQLIVVNTAWDDETMASAFFHQLTQVVLYRFLQGHLEPHMRRRHGDNAKRISRHLRRVTDVIARRVNLFRYGHYVPAQPALNGVQEQ